MHLRPATFNLLYRRCGPGLETCPGCRARLFPGNEFCPYCYYSFEGPEPSDDDYVKAVGARLNPLYLGAPTAEQWFFEHSVRPKLHLLNEALAVARTTQYRSDREMARYWARRRIEELKGSGLSLADIRRYIRWSNRQVFCELTGSGASAPPAGATPARVPAKTLSIAPDLEQVLLERYGSIERAQEVLHAVVVVDPDLGPGEHQWE